MSSITVAIADSKPPDLQTLVARYGMWPDVPPEGWAEFNSQMEMWKARLRAGEFHQHPRKGKRT